MSESTSISASSQLNNKGIIIQYEYCTGCHACEVACKKELDLKKGQFGVKVFEFGPMEKDDGRWDYFFLPAFTDLCDLCAARLEAGKVPSCVHNCQSKVMEYGDLDELAKKMAVIPKCVLYAPTVRQ